MKIKRGFLGFVFALLISSIAGLFIFSDSVVVSAREGLEHKLPRCSGSNIIEELEILEPKRFALLDKIASSEINDDAILWRVETADGLVSYLFGTFHSTDPRITKIPVQAEAAMNEATTIAVEVKNLDPKAMQTYIQQHPEIFFAVNGPKLNEYLNQDDFEVVSKLAVNKGMPSNMVSLLQPWFANISYFQIPACEVVRMGKGYTALDQQISNKALEDKKELVGLETLHDQFSAFASIPLQHQVTLLQDGIHNYNRMTDFYVTSIELYVKRQLGMLIPLSVAFGRDQAKTTAAFADFLDIMVVRRNKQMFDNSLPLVEKGGAFIAVGALHLVGRTGLVESYRRAGFKVDKID